MSTYPDSDYLVQNNNMTNTSLAMNGLHTLDSTQVELLTSLSLDVPAVLTTVQLAELLRIARETAEASFHPVLTPLVLRAISTMEAEHLLAKPV